MKALRRIVAPLVALAGGLLAPQAMAISVGPDAADHILTSDIDQTLYDYVDISATGATVVTGDDEVGNFTFGGGGDFYFYGQNRTQFRASTNGFLNTNLADANSDPANQCNWPNWPLAPASGDGDRILVMQDDLVTTVYYQYFDENNGPGAWIGDVSVIQWQGTYFGSAQEVDFEILFFHSLNATVMMYETVDQSGSSSTTAILNDGVTTGLLFDCDFATSVEPGLLLSMGTLKLNEIRTDQPGADDDEFFELTGVPGFDMTGLYFIALGDGTGNSGVIEEITDLSISFDPDNVGATLTSIGETGTTIGVDYFTSLSFENDDNVTYLLVDGFTGTSGQDLDIDDDGSLDILPWTRIVDEVAIVDNPTPDPMNDIEHVYSGVTVGPDPTLGAPFHVQRCGDHTGSWIIVGDGGALAGFDTPSGLNNCDICGNGIVEGTEDCDGDGAGTGGETATCNDDCTTAACGDGKLNTTASEQCDDGNGSNADDCPDDTGNGGTCQDAACGDGFINANGTNVEECDDGNVSNADDCPDDTGNGGTCQDAACGDGFVNTAGTNTEDCDEGVTTDTASCDGDCTDVVCGDGRINSMAGESCEDGNQTNGDDCPDDGANGGTCVAASCGDGFVDMQGGTMEECDGDGAGNPGQTATCDTDCTAATCGDGVVNSDANEDCDDTAESMTCDADCTDAACGDGTVNMTAGEECDDNNTTAGDGCDANCETEMGQGGMGGMGTGGMGTGGMGTGGTATGGAGTGGMGSGTGGTSSTGGGSNDDEDTQAEGGCDCSVPGNSAPNGAAPLALLLGLGLVARRRRRTA